MKKFSLKYWVILLMVIPGLANAQAKINVKDFGAKGDGVTDDYNALKKMADYVSSKRGGEVVFPKGVYVIAQHHTKSNNLPDIEFRNCKILKITGSQAIISVKGDFNRDATITRHGFKYSDTYAITPISVINSTNVQISNLEINGNVTDMTRDNGVAESGGDLISINGCTNIELSSLYLHHAHTDGLYINGKDTASGELNAIGLVCNYNARQGMSIIKLKNAHFTNCKFTNTGNAEGRYGNHAPSAGVDIEPSTDKLWVENITFNNCEFSNNKGGQFLISTPAKTSGVNLVNCKIDAGSSPSRYAMILAAKNVLIDNCQINCGGGNIYAAWDNMPNGSVTIQKSTIKSSAHGIMASATSNSDNIVINDNKLFFTGDSLISYFPYLQSPNLSFTNNEVFIPAKALVKKLSVQSLIQNAKKSSGNKFYSDVSAVKPKVSYTNTTLVKDN